MIGNLKKYIAKASFMEHIDCLLYTSFKYQGDDFYIAVEDEARFIMIWNPWWASISMDNPALPYLKEIVNLVNVD